MRQIVIITITCMLIQMISTGLCLAEDTYLKEQGLKGMLSPAIKIGEALFHQGIVEIGNYPAFNQQKTAIDLVVRTREKYGSSRAAKNTASSWPRFFLRTNNAFISSTLRNQLKELIQFMDSEEFQQLNSIQQLGQIRTLSSSLTPFEKILFYEGVFFAPEDSTDLARRNKKPLPDALDVIGAEGLIRDISKEERDYWHTVLTEKREKNNNTNIRSRQLIPIDNAQIFRMDYIEHPVEVKDKIIVENLGYCAGMIISSGKRLWFRRYAETPDIMDSLEADLSASNAAEMFNADTKIVFLNTSYGRWRWYFEQIETELQAKGVEAKNIIEQEWDTPPNIDGVSVYLFPDGKVTIHKKNFAVGVVESIVYHNYFKNKELPEIMDRDDIEAFLGRTMEGFLFLNQARFTVDKIQSSAVTLLEQAI